MANKSTFNYHEKNVLNFAWSNNCRVMASCGEERTM